MPAAAPVRLVSAPWVLPIVAPPLREGAVALAADDSVVAVGPRAELRAPGLPETRAAGALLPGLVNCHTHLEFTHLEGRVPGGEGLVAWTGRLLQLPAEMRAEMPQAARRGAAALVAAGTAAVGDVGNGLDAVPALAAAGLRGVFFHEILGTREARTGDALADAARERATVAWPDGLGYAPAPHAPYSVGPDLLRRTFAAAAATGAPTSVHVAEDPDEIELLLHGRGRWPDRLRALGVDPAERSPGLRPVAYLASLGAFAGPRPPLLVHMVHAGAEDRAAARAHGATVVLCPRSNLHVGGRLPDVPAMLADGLALALGTDSLASTSDLGLWGEMAALAAAFPAVPARAWLHAATAGGAAALDLAMGALAPGRRPGLIDVALQDHHAPEEALVRVPRPTVNWIARA